MASNHTQSGAGQDRRRARHATALLGKPPGFAELVPALSLVSERLSRAFAGALARLSGNDPPVVRVGMPMDGTLGSLQSELEGLAGHTLMALGPGGLPLLVTCEAHSVFRLVDRAFGGRGEVPEPMPESFPLSAELLMARIEQALADALGVALGGGELHRVRPVRRETSLRQLDPFPKTEELLMFTLDVEEAQQEPWTLQLAFPIPTLAAAIAVPRHPVVPRRRPARSDPALEPYASIPVEVTAVLVDMNLAMSRVSLLRPGDVLSIAVARSVPLQVDGRIFATGTIGELDDRVAVQIGNAF